MEYFIFIVFLLVAFAGLLSLVVGLPGNFIILADSILYGWYEGFEEITLSLVVILAFLVVLAEMLEYVLSVVSSKKHESSNKAVAASIIGGVIGAILGAPFFFGIGSIIGAFLGAFAGAFLTEMFQRKGIKQSMKSGWGAFVGRVGGTITKGVIGISMIAIVLVSVVVT